MMQEQNCKSIESYPGKGIQATYVSNHLMPQHQIQHNVDEFNSKLQTADKGKGSLEQRHLKTWTAQLDLQPARAS